MPLDLVKAHAYGNDFLFVPIEQTAEAGRVALARRLCDRHTGVGGDGLVLHAPTEAGARMVLHNADGGRAEVSGNAVRCLAAIVVRDRPSLGCPVIETDAGPIPLKLVGSAGRRTTFDALMASPVGLRRRELEAGGEQVEIVELSVGNPQCIVLGGEVSDRRLHRLGAALATPPGVPRGHQRRAGGGRVFIPDSDTHLGARRRSDRRVRHRCVRERGGRGRLRRRLARGRGRVPGRGAARALDGPGHPSDRVGGRRHDRALARLAGPCGVPARRRRGRHPCSPRNPGDAGRVQRTRTLSREGWERAGDHPRIDGFFHGDRHGAVLPPTCARFLQTTRDGGRPGWPRRPGPARSPCPRVVR